MIIETDSLTEVQQTELLNLWNAAYPATLFHPHVESFDRYLNDLENKKFYLILNNDLVTAFAMQFVRDEETWFAVIVNENAQKKGLGKSLLAALQSTNERLSGWVIDTNGYQRVDGQTYLSPLEFYIKNNFRIVEEQRLENERISAVKIIWNR